MVTKSVFAWVEAIADRIDSTYLFQTSYIFNLQGLAIDAQIHVQRVADGTITSLGYYMASAPLTCPDILLPLPPDGNEGIPSEPIHYYVSGYYVEGYYV